MKTALDQVFLERRRRDLNPRYPCGYSTLAGCYCRTGGQLLPRRSAPGNVRVACVSGRFRPATRNRVMHSMHSKSGENRHPRETRGHLGDTWRTFLRAPSAPICYSYCT